MNAGSRKDAVKWAVVTALVEKQILTGGSEPRSESRKLSDTKENGTGPVSEVELKQLDVKLKLEQLKVERMRMQLAFQEREKEILLRELEIEELRIKLTQQSQKTLI